MTSKPTPEPKAAPSLPKTASTAKAHGEGAAEKTEVIDLAEVARMIREDAAARERTLAAIQAATAKRPNPTGGQHQRPGGGLNAGTTAVVITALVVVLLVVAYTVSLAYGARPF